MILIVIGLLDTGAKDLPSRSRDREVDPRYAQRKMVEENGGLVTRARTMGSGTSSNMVRGKYSIMNEYILLQKFPYELSLLNTYLKLCLKKYLTRHGFSSRYQISIFPTTYMRSTSPIRDPKTSPLTPYQKLQ